MRRATKTEQPKRVPLTAVWIKVRSVDVALKRLKATDLVMLKRILNRI